jgi:hypothetical protein
MDDVVKAADATKVQEEYLTANRDTAKMKPPIAAIVQPKTVAEAKKIYLASGKEAIYPGFREIVCGAIDSNAKVEFENDSYFDALFLTDIMFSKAQREIRMMTGSLGEGFLKALEGSLDGALQRITEARGHARLIFVNSSFPEQLVAVHKKFPALEFRGATAPDGVSHFITCDSMMAREEQPHAPLTDDAPISAIKAKVYFNNPEKTGVMDSFFDTVWAKLRG